MPRLLEHMIITIDSIIWHSAEHVEFNKLYCAVGKNRMGENEAYMRRSCSSILVSSRFCATLPIMKGRYDRSLGCSVSNASGDKGYEFIEVSSGTLLFMFGNWWRPYGSLWSTWKVLDKGTKISYLTLTWTKRIDKILLRHIDYKIQVNVIGSIITQQVFHKVLNHAWVTMVLNKCREEFHTRAWLPIIG